MQSALRIQQESAWHRLLLFLILLLALFLRLYGLDVQSLWLDELYTMREADPNISWKETLDMVMTNEGQSPLFFFMEKLMFLLFGHTAAVARCLPALAGAAGVYGIYLLGRELHSSRSGLIAAAFTAVNYFHIYYCQDARGYSFLFLFSCLSFLFFVRLVRRQEQRNAVLYGLCTMVLLYFHYYSIFVLLAQLLVLLYLFIRYPERRMSFFRFFGLSGLIILTGYSPMIPSLLKMSEVRESWIPMVSPDFIQSYFYEFFGKADLIQPLLCGLIIYYLFTVFSAPEEENRQALPGAAVLTFLILLAWLITVYLVPYVRSLLVVSMVVTRYTIIGLPVFILAPAMGAAAIRNGLVRGLLVPLIVALSLVNLLLIRNYYTHISKSQFREMTAFICESRNENYPILNEKTSFQQKYYLDHFKSSRLLYGGEKEAAISSMLEAEGKGGTLNGFWLAGAHADPKLSPEFAQRLKAYYVLAQSKDFNDAWAQLYVPRGYFGKDVKELTYSHFNASASTTYAPDTVAAIWGGEPIAADSLLLPGGDFMVSVLCRGTPMDSIAPQISVLLNEQVIGTFSAADRMDLSPSFTFSLAQPQKVRLALRMENDGSSGQEDRNAFIKCLFVGQKK